MNNFGLCLIIAGAIWGVIAFNMKTTVETGGESVGSGLYSVNIPRQEVHNLDLADRRRNHLIGAGITLISGILLFGFGSLQQKNETIDEKTEIERKCPFCAERVKADAVLCRFCGKDLPALTDNELALNEVKTQRLNVPLLIFRACLFLLMFYLLFLVVLQYTGRI